MEMSCARVGSFSSRNTPAMPHAISLSSAKNPAPLSPFIRSTHASHSESENCDSLAKVEPNACGASCNARRRMALKIRAFRGVIGVIAINRVRSGVPQNSAPQPGKPKSAATALRHRLVQMRTRVMNQLHVVALNEGLRLKKALWRPAAREATPPRSLTEMKRLVASTTRRFSE